MKSLSLAIGTICVVTCISCSHSASEPDSLWQVESISESQRLEFWGGEAPVEAVCVSVYNVTLNNGRESLTVSGETGILDSLRVGDRVVVKHVGKSRHPGKTGESFDVSEVEISRHVGTQ